MAIAFTPEGRSLRIKVNDGMTAGGSPKTKNFTYSGIKPEASAENINTAGQALASLMKPDLNSLYVIDTQCVEDQI